METIQLLDAVKILAFRPLIHDAAVMRCAADALADACVQRYGEDLKVGDLFTSLAYIWDFSFDFPGISIWSVLNAAAAASQQRRELACVDHATANVLLAIPIESCGINFNESQSNSNPLMHAVETRVGPKTISTLIRLGAIFAVEDQPKIMPAIAACHNLQTMRALISLASKMRIVADVSQSLDEAGSTALHLCCGEVDRVKLLLEFGVCPLRRNANGSSARQCVQIRMAFMQLHFDPDAISGGGRYLAELKKLRLCYNALRHAEEAAVKTTIYLV